MAPIRSKYDSRNVESAEVSRRAADLRVAGRNWSSIAEEVGYPSPDAARMAVARFFSKHANNSVEEMRPVLQERGEYLWRHVVDRLDHAETFEEWDKTVSQAARVLSFQGRINGLMDKAPQVNVNIQERPDIQHLRESFIRIAGLEPPKEIEGEIVDRQENGQETTTS